MHDNGHREENDFRSHCIGRCGLRRDGGPGICCKAQYVLGHLMCFARGFVYSIPCLLIVFSTYSGQSGSRWMIVDVAGVVEGETGFC